MINRNPGLISHRLATTARIDFQNHSKTMTFMSFKSQYATLY